jgi:hypothetical protein
MANRIKMGKRKKYSEIFIVFSLLVLIKNDQILDLQTRWKIL